MTKDTRLARDARWHGKAIHKIGTTIGSILAAVITVYEISIGEGAIALIAFLAHISFDIILLYLFTR